MLEVICCPVSKKKLVYDPARNILSTGDIEYQIKGGIPMLSPLKGKLIKNHGK